VDAEDTTTFEFPWTNHPSVALGDQINNGFVLAFDAIGIAERSAQERPGSDLRDRELASHVTTLFIMRSQ
jgi:hypothetical protein